MKLLNVCLLELTSSSQQKGPTWKCLCGCISCLFPFSKKKQKQMFVIRKGILEKGSRLSSSVKPLMEPLPSEAVIDIKPEMDDDLIADEPLEISTNHSRTHAAVSRHSAEIYRPGQGQLTSASSVEAYSHARQQGSRTSRTSRPGSTKVAWKHLCSLSVDSMLDMCG